MNRTTLRDFLARCSFVVAVLAGGAAARGQTLAYDGFGNGPKSDLAGSTGGSGWTGAWTNAGADTTGIAGIGLSYPGLLTTPGAAVTPVAGGGFPSSVYSRGYPAPPAGVNSIYVSFLLRDDAAYGIWGGVSFGQYPYKMSVGSPPGYYTYGLLMSQGLGDFSNKPLIQGQTTLVVVRITRNPAGAGVDYRMYLDPTVGSGEPAFPDAEFHLAPVVGLPTSIAIDNGTGFTTDEVRLGTTWTSVLPPQPLSWIDLGFAKPGVSGAPHLVGSGPLSANSVNSIQLTNAKPAAPAYLIAGAGTLNVPFMGGTLVPDPVVILPLTTDAAGSLTLQALWPAGIPGGAPIRFQYWIQDPAATFGLSASNGLQGISR